MAHTNDETALENAKKLIKIKLAKKAKKARMAKKGNALEPLPLKKGERKSWKGDQNKKVLKNPTMSSSIRNSDLCFYKHLKFIKTIDKSIFLVFDQINLSSAKSAIHFIDPVSTFCYRDFKFVVKS